jgi:hypothetical protein
MVQKEQVRRAPATVGAMPDTVPETTRETRGHPRSSPWLIGALVGVTIAFLALAGWTVYQRYMPSPSERIAQNAAAAWDGASPAALATVYSRGAVVVQADGTRLNGIHAIIQAAKGNGSGFSMSQIGQLAGSRDGSLVMLSYAPAGTNQVTGIALLEVENGKIIRQWNFEPSSASAGK